jgi:cytoskeletal protein CcmA (bactofilin family)
MFKKESIPRTEARPSTGPEAGLSIISAGVRIVGDVESSGILKVDGTIDGSVRGTRQVLLGSLGSILGDVSTCEAVVAGAIHGSISASVRLELQSTAVVNGDIATKSIIVLEGARINGTVQMSGPDEHPGSNVERVDEPTGVLGQGGAIRLRSLPG